MINWKTITEAEAEHAIERKEFPDSVIASQENVALVLTQGWCPDWAALKHNLERIAPSQTLDLDLYVFIYDRSPLFSDFLSCKETSWGNDRIPYVRYYRNGAFLSDSNYVGIDDFISRFH